MRFCLLLLALPLWAADDVNSILKRLIEVQQQAEERARQYTYVDETRHFTLDKNGQARPTHSETHEIIYVEGLRYNKLVARDGKPLSAHEQAKVEKELRETAEERRRRGRVPAAGGAVVVHGLFAHQSSDLGSLSELLTLFDNRLVGEEEIRGHKVWVVESTPQSRTDVSEHERGVLAFRKKFWIDQAENVLVRSVYTVAAEGSAMGPGSTLTFDWDKIDPNTWQVVSIVADFSPAKRAVFKPVARTVDQMSNFQKFDVQSTITVAEPGK